MECTVCQASSVPMKRCARCHNTIYCSSKCQRDDWLKHRVNCERSEGKTKDNTYTIQYYNEGGRPVSESVSTDIACGDILVYIKSCRHKTSLKVCKQWDGSLLFKLISQETRIPLGEMKVIVKGKVVVADDITQHISPKTLFMVLGNKVASSEGLEEKDIQCLMSQMNVSRNAAILALRKCGTLLDAMLDLGR